MNILLIGGNGFVGQALIKEFKKYKVVVTSYLEHKITQFLEMMQCGYREIFSTLIT